MKRMGNARSTDGSELTSEIKDATEARGCVRDLA